MRRPVPDFLQACYARGAYVSVERHEFWRGQLIGKPTEVKINHTLSMDVKDGSSRPVAQLLVEEVQDGEEWIITDILIGESTTYAMGKKLVDAFTIGVLGPEDFIDRSDDE